ncbi:MAG: response regulator [Myxococcaceae bacterium]|jgi:DNA-binding response OmpR family regulator|nr:response regulator [Myxococcaceae bacterium]
MARSETRILIVDADQDAAQRMGLALDGAGFQVAWCTFSPQDFQAMSKDFGPSLLFVHADLGSAQLTTLLARVDAAGAATVPVVLLCRDLGDEAFVRAMKTGVVEMLQEPFNARLHASRLRLVLAELPDRSGVVRGRGGPGELSALLQHVMRTRRTGGLAVGANDEGRAYFVRGVLKSARFQSQSMQGALAAMSRLTVPWTFTEGAEGNAGVIDFEGDESSGDPYMMTYRDNAAPTRTVTAELPIVQALPEPAPAPIAAAAPPVDAEAAKTPVLFVDDDPAVVTMLASYFTKKGYPVKTAGDGVEALALLAAQRFEVVVADLNMPRLDGWGLLRLIREDVRTAEVPVALFSAQDDYRESLRLVHAGAQAYFPKTLRLTALEAQVKELVEPRRRFLRNLPPEGGLSFGFGALGPQWVLKALDTTRFSGQLDARDAWGQWRAWFEGGRLAQMTAKMGASTLSGDRALCTFLMSRQSEGTLSREGRAPEEGFARHSTDGTLARLVPWLNDEQKRTREDQLSRAKALVPDDELYRLYLTVGPPAWLPIARLLCEQRLAPVDVINRLQVTPMEVAAVVKDLLRRGVVSLQT